MPWTPACLSIDLPPRAVLPAVVEGVEVAVWRGTSGRVAAWRDRCPHRGMRLSHGFVRGDWLSCLYHGWRYDEGGTCRKIPAHPDLTPPETIRTTALACAEAGGVVWVAPEAPDAAPPDLAGWEPLRSLAVEAPAERLAEAAGVAAGPTLEATLGGLALRLLLQPLPLGVMVHALARPADPERRVAASRALDSLRRAAEGEAA